MTFSISEHVSARRLVLDNDQAPLLYDSGISSTENKEATVTISHSETLVRDTGVYMIRLQLPAAAFETAGTQVWCLVLKVPC